MNGVQSLEGRAQLNRDNVKGGQYLHKNDTGEMVGYHNSEMRTKIVASIEVVHGCTRRNPALKTKQITPLTKDTVDKPPL